MRLTDYTRYLLILFCLCCTLKHQAQVTTQTFVYTGTVQTFTVPACVFQVTVDLRGAQGGMANDKVPLNGPGGLGGWAFGVMTVTPGQVINILVGGQGFTTGVGGYNGGGSGGYGTAGGSCFGGFAGGGGGATDLRIGGLALSNRVVVAGGGGGAGRDYCNGTCQPCGCGGNGGCGGGLTGNNGLFSLCTENTQYYPGNMMNGAGPGTQSSGGTGAPADNSTTQSAGTAGTNGSVGIGGDGGGGAYDVAGGGGGGGWFGGGGGGGANSGSGVGGGGGGGGSSYIANLTNANTSSCVHAGNGVAIIKYEPSGTLVNAVANPSAICSGGSTTLTASGQVTYTWSTGSFSNSIVVSPTTSTYYIASGTNSIGCSSTQTIFITVDTALPNVISAASPTVVCPGNPATLSASGALTYTWSNGLANGTSFTPSVTGTYSVTGANGCGTNTSAVSVSVMPQFSVTAVASQPSVCLGNTTAVTASGAQTYLWSHSLQNGISFQPSSTNAYTVTGTGSLCPGSAVVSVTVVAFSGPVVTSAPANTAICLGSTITLNASGVSTYTWNNGSTTSTISVSPTSNASYTVSGTNSAGCISKTVTTISVDPATPALALNTSTTSVCPGKSVTIVASGATSYTFPGGVSNNIPFIPVSTTTYVVQGANACGSMSAATVVTVNAAPGVTAVAVTPTICALSPATVLATGANSYVWSGNIPNGQSFYPSTTQNYTVTGYSVFGCTNTAITTVTVFPTPNVNPLPSPPLICNGQSATIASSGASNYSWMPGGNTTASIVVNPTITTVYSLTQAIGPCSSVKSATVIVNQLPTPSALASPSVICASASATLQGGGALSFTWTAPNFTSVGATVPVNPAVSTTYSLAASDGTCLNTTTVQLNTNPNPVITLVPSSTAICSGNSATLTATGGLSYTWNPAPLSGSSAVVSPTQTSLYTVIGENTFNCTSAAQVAIIVNTTPTISASPNKPLVCSGNPSTLFASGASSYSWDTGAQGSSAVVNPTATTVYTVTGWFPTKCSNTRTVSVDVFLPDFNVPADAGACLGGSVTLVASGAMSYTWNGNHPFASIVVSPTVYTVYMVSATSTSNNVNCISSKTVGVNISPNPTVTASANSTLVCKGSKALLTGKGADTYVWTGFTPGQTIQPVVNAGTTYSVVGTNTAGCISSATILVKISTCIGIDELNSLSDIGLKLYPNPSTGNFVIESNDDLELIIYNEIGQLIRLVRLSENNQHKVQVSDLSKGTYFITGQKNNVLIREKIVVLE